MAKNNTIALAVLSSFDWTEIERLAIFSLFCISCVLMGEVATGRSIFLKNPFEQLAVPSTEVKE